MSYCKGKKVLHLGCSNSPYTLPSIANGSILHFELQKVASELYGFDFDDEGLAILDQHGVTNLYKADLEHLEDVDLDTTFDVIIAGEMIEHLNNPGLFLNGIKRFMNADTELVITTINAYCGMRFFWYGLTKNHGRNEPVHPDHVAYYSYATLNLLIKRHGLDVSRFMFYDMGREHRPGLRLILKVINDVSVRFARQWCDGIIAVCKLSSS
ncbi:MAG: methyltransferase domain-containing protein [Acidobacteriota bacterium]